MSVEDCVYGCRHPLWGGQGICSRQADHADSTCLCDRGYLSLDSDGSPSCVRKSSLVAIFVTVALISYGASGYLLWQAREQRRLPGPVQLGRKAVLRLRVIVASRLVETEVFDPRVEGSLEPESFDGHQRLVVRSE